jgi:hypothetical protein
MRFMILVKANADSEAGKMPDTKILEAMGKFNEELVNAGVMLAGEGLKPSKDGARIQFTDGKVHVTDGPFTETKELIAGFWIIQAKSLTEAIEWMKRAPHPPAGSKDVFDLEIRPIFETEEFAEVAPEVAEQELKLRDRIAQQQKQ